MPRRTRTPGTDTAQRDATDPRAPEPGVVAPTPAAQASLGSLADLPVAGLTRRRVALMLGALIAAWVIVLFARQVSEASEATARADAMRVANVQLESDVSALQAELALIQRQEYISQAARAYRLGKPREIPVALADDAPPLADDAPGSAKVRLGTKTETVTPLESWARLLFGDPAEPSGS